jgi:SAM-dependent methyltransferase
MPSDPFSSRTYDPRDLDLPQTAPWASALRRFALRLGFEGTPFAVNGILRWRVWVQRHKLWEYAAMAACLFHRPGERRLRILDFGGAATLPIYFLCSRGCEVECLDIDLRLCEATRRAAERHSWPLRAGSLNIAESPPPKDWEPFDAVISASVLEHVPKAQQGILLMRLASVLRPGGMLILTFDYGEDAPQPGAIRSVEEVASLVAASGLESRGGEPFRDTGKRFPLDRRFPSKLFTFGALFLEKKV